MPEGQVLEFSAVTKRFGAVTAVDGFTARVEPGKVTGFLGPNGAGKTTTLRILLGLVRATTGTATIGGVPYAKLENPLRTVGAVLEASSFHPGRTAANHLKVYAQAAGLPNTRVDDALGLVGLTDVAGRKVGGYSLGMRQRLGLAYALIGDPGVLVLDEPANGLDPEGIKWMRGLLRDLARQGRTVLVSSHLLAEVQQTVDSLLILSAGRLVFQGGLDELTDPDEFATVVDSSDRAGLTDALAAAGIEVEVLRSGLTVRGHDPAAVGRAAAAAGIALTALQRRGPALEEVFLDLVNGVRVHASAAGASVAAAVAAGTAAGPVSGDVAEREPAAAAEPEHDAAIAAGAGLAAGVVLADAGENEADATTAPDAAPPAGAAFAVASTGVIDVVPPADEGADEPGDEDGSSDEPGDAAGDEPGTTPGEDEAGPEADTSPEADASSEGDAAAAGESMTQDHSTPVDDPAPDEGLDAEDGSVVEAGEEDAADSPGTEDRPWETYVRTDSDEEADRFFASFDEHGNEIFPTAAGESADADSAPAPETQADAGAVAGADEAPSDEPPSDERPSDEPTTDEAPGDETAPEERPSEDSGEQPTEDSGEQPTEESGAETGEFGTIADLSPDWSAEDVGHTGEAQEGEQR